MIEQFHDGRVVLFGADCLKVMAKLRADSFDSCATDPPYHLVSIHERFAKTGGADRQPGTDAFGRLTRGFMGKVWDGGDVAFRPETWAAVLRLLKPGAYLVAFSGTRTYHRMACAIEDSGFEIRDQIGWIFGTGFPKTRNHLKPAWEPICLARKPLAGTVAENVAAHGTGALNIDGCRIPGWKPQVTQGINSNATSFNVARERQISGDSNEGRWPANIAHDGSAEVLAAFPDTAPSRAGKPRAGQNGDGWGMTTTGAEYNDAGGSAARFFYSAKANKTDRAGSRHPTVKPIALMQWLVRLITPRGGRVLDPFAGTGTTAEAALREGLHATLIEREAEYRADIERRMERALMGEEELVRAILKEAGEVESPGPLFPDYDAAKDVEGCFNDAYAAIRERVAGGGPGWVPKDV